MLSSHLRRLEAEAIFILREAVAELKNPVTLFFDRERFLRHASSCVQSLITPRNRHSRYCMSIRNGSFERYSPSEMRRRRVWE